MLHLHALKAKLEVLLDREGRTDVAEACFAFLPSGARLDLMGWPEVDIFAQRRSVAHTLNPDVRKSATHHIFATLAW